MNWLWLGAGCGLFLLMFLTVEVIWYKVVRLPELEERVTRLESTFKKVAQAFLRDLERLEPKE